MKRDIAQISACIETYEKFIQPYQDACQVVSMWLENMQKEFGKEYNHNPVHSIQKRIKSLNSIADKLGRKGHEVNLENAMAYLTDIAGVRVICYYIQDVYVIAGILKNQPDTVLIKETDYIKNPKPNGYRSYHMVLGITLHQVKGKQYFPVEIQIRTLAMDFWASMEHQLCYKTERTDIVSLSGELTYYADMLHEMERRISVFYDCNIPVPAAEAAIDSTPKVPALS